MLLTCDIMYFVICFTYRWALWYFKNDKSKDWKDCLKLVIAFDTVCVCVCFRLCVHVCVLTCSLLSLSVSVASSRLKISGGK